MKNAIIRIYIVLLSLLFVTFFGLMSANAENKLKLEIVYPENNANINAYSTFFVGNTTPKANLKINNQKVTVYPNGGFVHVINLSPGANTVNIKSTLENLTQAKSITINTPLHETTIPQSPLKIDTISIQPNKNVVYKTGDLLQVNFKGSTGNKAYFSIGNLRKNIPMIEEPPKFIKTEPVFGSSTITSSTPIKGIYKGSYRIQSKDKFNSEPLIIKLVSENSKADFRAPVAISTIASDSPPIIAKVTTDYATIRTSPDTSRLTPLPEGTLLNLTGKIGNEFKFALGDTQSAWISSSDITILPPGTPVSESNINLIDTVSEKDSVYLKIPLSQRLPLIIDQTSPNSMSIKLFGAKANINVFKNKDKFIKQVNWIQDTKDSVKIKISVNSSQFWGYKYYYEGDTLVLKLRKPPEINPDKPFQNITICIDPGHGGKEKGSVGPTGVPEKTVNLGIALSLEKNLKAKGANVVMTRTMDEDAELYDRVKYAAAADSLILLSLHNNALPDGRNPYEDHGTSSYYYHAQSLPLTKILHKALLEDIQFSDFGVFWSSFALTRPHESLAVLLETGFMINPDEYNLLIQPDFQEKIANSITRGLEYFLFINSELAQKTTKQN
ncbi:MAG TPA: N-acetylmuramoyl-L-alanine amidase [Candidatus Gastranaerophilales bacterium]|nr:N-acetylmuramoyl-L-alanine amidase [Candidatus Gastranaerophilales bacterium]